MPPGVPSLHQPSQSSGPSPASSVELATSSGLRDHLPDVPSSDITLTEGHRVPSVLKDHGGPLALQCDFHAPGPGSPAVGPPGLPSQNSHMGSHGPLGCHQERWYCLYLIKVHTSRGMRGLALGPSALLSSADVLLTRGLCSAVCPSASHRPQGLLIPPFMGAASPSQLWHRQSQHAPSTQ